MAALLSCGKDDDCPYRAYCHKGACVCFSDYGTTGLPGCSHLTWVGTVAMYDKIPNASDCPGVPI